MRAVCFLMSVYGDILSPLVLLGWILYSNPAIAIAPMMSIHAVK